MQANSFENSLHGPGSELNVQISGFRLTGTLKADTIRRVVFRERREAVGKKLRLLLTIIILAGVISWIVLSYLPSSLIALPQFQAAPAALVNAVPALVVVSLLVFIGLQVWLVQSTAASIKRPRDASRGQVTGRFELNAGREAVLTALPIGFTVLLALAAYGWWQKLLTLF